MTNLDFLRPESTVEACALLARYGGDATILAGGTDLMVAVNHKERPLETVIYIGGVGLDYIRTSGDALVIGAATTHAAIARSATIRETAPLLVAAVGSIGSPAVRNMGTIGGNIANASPGADGSAALLALGAKVKLRSATGERTVDLANFFAGEGKTDLNADELVEEVIVPLGEVANRWHWYKLGQRKASVCAVISVAMAVRLEEGICRHARIALGTVAPASLLAAGAGDILAGQRLEPPVIEKAARAATEMISERDGVRATAWYRRKICEVQIRRFLGSLSAEKTEVV